MARRDTGAKTRISMALKNQAQLLLLCDFKKISILLTPADQINTENSKLKELVVCGWQ
jgi:hypothetical protein